MRKRATLNNMTLFLVMGYHNMFLSNNLPIAWISVLIANILLSQIKQAFSSDAVCLYATNIIQISSLSEIIASFCS